LGRAAAKSHLQNWNSDPFRDFMDQPKDCCLAGSRSAGKDAEWIVQRHFHGSALRGIEFQPSVAPMPFYRFRNNGREVPREQISFGPELACEQLAQVTGNNLLHHGGADRLVAIR
jgi:hypothetical protein